LMSLLRSLGAETKPIDYIIWAMNGRPAPEWEAAGATA